MPRKYTKHSTEIKNKIINEYIENKQYTSYRMLGDKYNIKAQTISTWVHQRKNAKGERQKGNFNEENIDYKERYEILKKFLDSQK